MQVAPHCGKIRNQCKWRRLVAKFAINASCAIYESGATWWPNLHLVQVTKFAINEITRVNSLGPLCLWPLSVLKGHFQCSQRLWVPAHIVKILRDLNLISTFFFFTKLKICSTQPKKEKTIISKRQEGKTILFLEEQIRKLQEW